MDILNIFWFLFFSAVFIALLRKMKEGSVYSPFFLVSAAYILIMVVGTFTFEFLRSKPSKLHLLSIVGLGYIAFVFGLAVGHVRIMPSVRKTTGYVYRLIMSKKLFALSVLVFIFMSMLFFLKAGQIPMFSKNVDQARMDALMGAGIVRIFMFGLPVAVVFYWYDYLNNPSRKRLIISVFLIALTILILLGTGFRNTTVLLLGQLFIVYFFCRRVKFPLMLAILGLVALYGLLGIIGAYRRFGSIDEKSFLFELAIILTARPAALDLILKKYSTFQWGMTYVKDLFVVLPGHQVGANTELKYQIFRNADKMPESAGINPSILGEFYINFGYYGMYLGMVAFGFILAILYIKARKRQSREAIILYAIFIMYMVGAIQNGIGARLIPLIGTLFWFFFISLLARRKIWVK